MTMVAVDWGRPRLVRAADGPRGGYWGSVVSPSYVGGTGSVRRPVEGSGPTLRDLLLRSAASSAEDDDALLVALHEAAHAVVAEEWDIPVVTATVRNAQGDGGVDFVPSWRNADDAVRLAVIIAGRLAVQAAGLVNEDQTCRHDDHLAAALESRMDAAEIALSARLADRAITDNWPALTNLAATLDAAVHVGRPVLTGDQVRRVLALGDVDDAAFKNAAYRIVMG